MKCLNVKRSIGVKVLGELENQSKLRFLGRTAANEAYKLWQGDVEGLFTETATSYELSATESGLISKPFNTLNNKGKPDTLYHLRLECNPVSNQAKNSRKEEVKRGASRVTHYEIVAINGRCLNTPIRFKNPKPKAPNKLTNKTEYQREIDQKLVNILYRHEGLNRKHIIEICKLLNPRTLFTKANSACYNYYKSIVTGRKINRHSTLCSVIGTEEKFYVVISNDNLTFVVDSIGDPSAAFDDQPSSNQSFKHLADRINERFMLGLYINVKAQRFNYINLYDHIDIHEDVYGSEEKIDPAELSDIQRELVNWLDNQDLGKPDGTLVWSNLKPFRKMSKALYIDSKPNHYTIHISPTR